MTIENVGFPVREPMLAAGEVDAITGFSFSSFLNLKSKLEKPSRNQRRINQIRDHWGSKQIGHGQKLLGRMAKYQSKSKNIYFAHCWLLLDVSRKAIIKTRHLGNGFNNFQPNQDMRKSRM